MHATQLPHTFALGGFLELPAAAIGAVSIVLAVMSTALRKSIALRLSPQFGSERLFALGVAAAAVWLAPLTLYQTLNASDYWPDESSSFFSSTFYIVVMSGGLIVLDYGIEMFASRHLVSEPSFDLVCFALFLTSRVCDSRLRWLRALA